jgi:hypothetical protein
VRAHGTVAQPQLDALRDGVTISGIRYGAIDASVERVQGSMYRLAPIIRARSGARTVRLEELDQPLHDTG